MSTPTVLPAAAVARLDPAASLAGGTRFLPAALLRALLYLAVTGVALWLPLPWPAGAAVLVAGWAAVATLARRRRAAAHLLVGLGQAALVALLWRTGQDLAPAGPVPAGLVPVLAAVPLIEIGVGWHRSRLAAALTRYDDRAAHDRYARRLAWATLAALLPPLMAAAALAATATRLPYGLSAHPDAPALVLVLAAGMLLAGVLALGWLLAAHDRPGLAVVFTGALLPGTFAIATGLATGSLPGWGTLLPALAVTLAVGYATGLVLTTQVVASPRSCH